jgi:seryl-tRNA synthetase
MLKHLSFRERLLDAGVLFATGVDGLYGRSATFERIVDGLENLVTRSGAFQAAEFVRFPPAMTRSTLEQSGYLKSFPHLAGTIHCFCGNDAEHRVLLDNVRNGQTWTDRQAASELVMTPAACYPVYPLMASRGPLPQEGRIVDVSSYCFRHEPSIDAARMQMFRMREFVRLGTAEQVGFFRDAWMERGRALIESLGLPVALDVANDPFFGRAGRVMAESQRAQALKFELLIAINDDGPTACMSFNYHRSHFAEIWDLRTSDGEQAHTGCVGFGLERLTLALLRHHGFETPSWPEPVRAALWPAT